MAAVAGVLLILSGVTGASQWERTFRFVADLIGPSALLRAVAIVFIAIGHIGGLLVILGAYAFREDRVRTGRVLILLGTGFTLISLILFVLLQIQHRDLPFAGAGVLGVAGIVLSIVARRKARPKPLLK